MSIEPKLHRVNVLLEDLIRYLGRTYFVSHQFNILPYKSARYKMDSVLASIIDVLDFTDDEKPFIALMYKLLPNTNTCIMPWKQMYLCTDLPYPSHEAAARVLNLILSIMDAYKSYVYSTMNFERCSFELDAFNIFPSDLHQLYLTYSTEPIVRFN